MSGDANVCEQVRLWKITATVIFVTKRLVNIHSSDDSSTNVEKYQLLVLLWLYLSSKAIFVPCQCVSRHV